MANADSTPDSPLAKTLTCHERHIKVGRTVSDYRPKHANPNQPNPPIPWIRLQGKWLDSAGFAVGTPLKIRVMNQCLVITANESYP